MSRPAEPCARCGYKVTDLLDGVCISCDLRSLRAQIVRDVAAAKKLGARGMAITTSVHPDEAAKVDAAIKQLASTGREFDANEARRLHGITGAVVGARFQAAARAGLIRRVGYTPSSAASTHGHPVARWQGVAA